MKSELVIGMVCAVWVCLTMVGGLFGGVYFITDPICTNIVTNFSALFNVVNVIVCIIVIILAKLMYE